MALNTQQLFEIVGRQVEKMRVTHEFLSTQKLMGHISPIDDAFLTKIDRWARGILGVVEGYGMEFEAYYKHRILKGRAIVPTQRGIADIVIGHGQEVYAKAIQSKSTVQTGPGAINGFLTKAFEQLTGVGHEHPRPTDRPTILITIWDPANSWPFSDHQLLGTGPPNVVSFKSSVVESVSAAINNFIGMSLQTNNPRVGHFLGKFPVLPNQNVSVEKLPHGTLPRQNSTPDYVYQHPQGGPKQIIKTLLVKIKWPVTYVCAANTYVSGLSLVGDRQPNGQFRFLIQKEKIEVVAPMGDDIEALFDRILAMDSVELFGPDAGDQMQ